MENRECGVLSPIALGLALGLLTAISIVCMALLAGQAALGVGVVHAIASMYMGISSTGLGILIGGVAGFLDGFIWGVVWAYLYNFFVKNV